MVAARQVGAADRALKEHVAAEQRVLGGDRVGDVARGVAGREDDVDLEAGESKLLAAGDQVVGLVALERAEARPRHVVHDVGEHLALELGAVHRRARRARERCDGADVVEVRVREQDRLHRRVLDGGDQALGLVARIDDERAVAVADDEAVLLHLPDGEHLDVHQRAACCFELAVVDELVREVHDRRVHHEGERAEGDRLAGRLSVPPRKVKNKNRIPTPNSAFSAAPFTVGGLSAGQAGGAAARGSARGRRSWPARPRSACPSARAPRPCRRRCHGAWSGACASSGPWTFSLCSARPARRAPSPPRQRARRPPR